ncbi:hypothetical protein ScPMuIL_003361 [Solemya velum]
MGLSYLQMKKVVLGSVAVIISLAMIYMNRITMSTEFTAPAIQKSINRLLGVESVNIDGVACDRLHKMYPTEAELLEDATPEDIADTTNANTSKIHTMGEGTGDNVGGHNEIVDENKRQEFDVLDRYRD